MERFPGAQHASEWQKFGVFSKRFGLSAFDLAWRQKQTG
jgi:hypothetical protein